MARKRRILVLDAAVYGLVRGFFWLLDRCPEPIVYPALDLLGRAFFVVARGRRRIALANLQQAFGAELSRRQLVRIGSRACGSVFMVLADIARMRRYLASGELLRRIDRAPWERDSVLPIGDVAHGRPPIICGPHLGSWEAAGTTTGLAYRGLHVIARPLGNPFLERWLLATRTLAGQRLLPRRGGIRRLLQALRDGHAVAMLPDQNQRLRGIFVPVFGKLASCDRSPARLAQLSGAPILVGAALRKGRRFRFTMEVTDMFTVPRGGSETVRAATERLQRAVEKVIRLAPDQYFWLHNRYRTRPPEERPPA
jgi:KDO2-lipid IV(A) lauroyltransferase